MPIPTEMVAKVCHEANRAYCQTISDDSQVPWNEAPEWQRESAVHGVEAIIDNPVLTPEQSHESWMQEKRDAGWSYGSIKDVEKKLHPCFMAYAGLPEEQKAKDHLFQAVARALLG